MISRLIEDQLSVMGTAQVIVVIKPSARTTERPTSDLAAAIPVKSLHAVETFSHSLLREIGAAFRIRETSQSSAMAAADVGDTKSAGIQWFEKASSAANSTPAARIFPNLGVMLGSIDQTGLSSLRHNPDVADVLLAPKFSLIRPVDVKPASGALAASASWGIKRLKADVLHDNGITGKGVIVGHLDTGYDGKHPALKPALHAFAQFDQFGFEVSPTPDAFDSDEHGTHTAGTIGGRTVGGTSIGVAPGCTIASAMVIEGGDVIARILGGMDWALGQQCRILSMSLGLRGFVNDFLTLTQLLRQKGVLPVFAVGNEGPGTSRSPGNYDETLSVGAMAKNERVANFSSSQRFARWSVPDIVAPGVDILSAMPGGGYQTMSGSSMATPHIAGLAALLFEAVPSASVDQIEQAIFTSCTQLPSDPIDRQNHGVPDATLALKFLQTAAGAVANPSPVNQEGTQLPVGVAVGHPPASRPAKKKAVKKAAKASKKTSAKKKRS